MAEETTVLEQAAETIREMEEEARTKRHTAEPGEVLSEAELEGGMVVRRRQPNSMVRSGDVQLPERVRYYRSSNGWEAWLPTAQLVHHLSKRHPDGTPVFVKQKPVFEQQEEYEETCPICLRNSMGRVRKSFTDEFQYVGHMEAFHPSEFRVIQARQERERGKNVSGADIATALLQMGENERAAFRALLGEEKHDGATGQAHCEACGWTSRRVKNAAASLRTHTNLHCPKRAGGSTNGEQ